MDNENQNQNLPQNPESTPVPESTPTPEPSLVQPASQIPLASTEKKSLDLSHITQGLNQAADDLAATPVAAGVVPKAEEPQNNPSGASLNTTESLSGKSMVIVVTETMTTAAGILLLCGVLVTLMTVNFNAFKGLFGSDPQVSGGIIRFLASFIWGAFTVSMLLMLITTIYQFFFGKSQQVEKSQGLLVRLIIVPILLIVGGAAWYIIPQFVYVPETTTEDTAVLPESKYTSPQMIALEKDEDSGTLKRTSNTKNLVGPITLQFDTTSYIPAETQFYKITNYEWDVNGDGTFEPSEGTDAIATAIYTEKKEYLVALKVRKELLRPQDGKKAGDIVEEIYGPGEEKGGMTILVTKIRPSIKLTVDPENPKGGAPLTVNVDATGSVGEGKLTKFSWDFDGDGKEDALGVKQSYTYDKPGFYRATLTVSDEQGLSATKTIEVDVSKTSEPQAKIDASTFQGQAPLSVAFDGTKSTAPEGRIISYKWDFGDASPEETGEKISHDYSVPGKFKVKLVVETDLKKTAETTEDITVTAAKGAPTARIMSEVNGQPADTLASISGKVPLVVKFDSSFSTDPENDIVRREWDFQGDKKFDESGTSVSYTYNAPGKYLVTLRLTDSSKNISEAVVNVEVKADDLIAVISADPNTGESPLWVAFDGSSSNYTKGQIVSYTWDFGDGTPAQVTGATISHQYQTSGTFTATLTIQTSDGKSMSAKRVISVLQDALVPAFSILPSFGPAPLDVEVDARASKGQIISYRWEFGDGTVSTGSRATHTYATAGTYTVTLRVQDVFGNAQKTVKNIIVTK